MEKVIILNATELGYQVVRALGRHGIRSIVLYDKEKDELGRYSKYAAESIKIPASLKNQSYFLGSLLRKKRSGQAPSLSPRKTIR